MTMYLELSAAAQTAYANLAQAARQAELSRSIAHAPGGFVKKTIKGRVYWYYQVKSAEGKLTQMYVGPDDESTRALVAQHGDPKAKAAHVQLARLCEAAMVLGCYGVIPKHARVLARLAHHGLFRAGGILVGTHAFLAYQNHFGVRWGAADTTVDLDFEHPGKRIALAMPAAPEVDIPDAIESLKMGFLPVNDGTRYVKPDEPDFDLDFLTARHRGGDAPVRIPQLNLTLQPLKFMEFSMEEHMQIVLPATQGPIVANVPQPQRYALAKLLVHGERRSHDPTKSIKDLDQAAALIDYLSRNQPDELRLAWDDLISRGPGWRTRATQGIEAVAKRHPQAECVIELPTPRAGSSKAAPVRRR
jgi:hypothetical protein